MPEVKNVSTGKPKIEGAVYTAPLGTTLPTDALSALPAAWKELGYVSEDGFTNNNSRETEELKAWGGDVVDTPLTNYTDAIKLKFIEILNVEVLKAVYGKDNVSGDLDNGITIRANSREAVSMSWVIDMILRGGVMKRTVIPEAKLKEMSEIVYKDNEDVGYECTYQCFGYDTWDGDTHREYIQKSPTLGTLTVSSVAGTNVGDTKITVTEEKGSGNSYRYKVADAATDVTLDMDVSGWTSWNGSADITAQTGKVITVVEADGSNKAKKAGSTTVTAKSA